jgi:hypothetical protein
MAERIEKEKQGQELTSFSTVKLSYANECICHFNVDFFQNHYLILNTLAIEAFEIPLQLFEIKAAVTECNNLHNKTNTNILHLPLLIA